MTRRGDANEDTSGRPRTQSLDYTLRSLIAGGVAGGVAKTTFAPFERVRILFQVQHAEYTRFSGSLRGSVYAVRYIFTTQGFKALYKGHSLSLARAVPHAAVGFTAYEYARAIIMPSAEKNTPIRRFAAGAVAGLASLPITYPFELVRVRMAIDAFPISSSSSSNHLPSSKHPPQPQSILIPPPSCSSSSSTGQSRITPLQAIRFIYQTSPRSTLFPLAPFYSGFPITALGSVPYRGGIFLIWETLHAKTRQHLGSELYQSYKIQLDFSLGAISGAGAQAITYPLEIVRRRQQVQTLGNKVIQVTRSIWQRQGWRGFYVGLGLGLVKQIPMNAVSLGTWQAAKRALGID